MGASSVAIHAIASAMRTIYDYVRTRIADARRQTDSSCLLGLLAATALTDEELLDEGTALGITGYEPVGEGLVWAMWLIAQHPEVQAKIRDRRRWTRLRCATPELAVLQESMRLYPPTWLFTSAMQAHPRDSSGER